MTLVTFKIVTGIRWHIRNVWNAEHRSALTENAEMRLKLQALNSAVNTSGLHLPTLNLAAAKRTLVERAIELNPTQHAAESALGVSRGSLTQLKNAVGLPVTPRPRNNKTK